MQFLVLVANINDKSTSTMIAMNGEKATSSNNIEPTPEQRESGVTLAPKPSQQFEISIVLGTLTILILGASYYYGIIRF